MTEKNPNKKDNNQPKKEEKKNPLKLPVGKIIIPNKSSIKKPRNTFWSNITTAILIFLTITALYSFISEEKAEDINIPVSELAQNIKDEKVQKIIVQGEELKIALKSSDGGEGTEKKSKKESGTALSDTLANYGVTPEQLTKVQIEVKEPSGFAYWFLNLAPFLLPIIFILFLIWYFSRQVKGAGMQAFTFGQSRPKIVDPRDTKQKVTFKDVAGAKEAKEELSEIVDFLRSPKKFLEIGARIPKGVLLMGAPGTGKTLLARAVAGEAGVSFFSISGSEFVEMFVGVGASRVRDLFKLAKHVAPAIIFIDEIDAVGRTRGSGHGGGNDEREQTLNQILVEMDGFEENEKIIIMAATNRPDVLDPAILRPGRFDRRVVIDLPDREDRLGILEVHARGKPLAEDVNLNVIAQRTPGFSGADLYSLMNEAAILAAREERKKVSQFDLVRSIEKVMLGPERRSHLLSKKEKEITAYHEAGHALVASVLPFADPVHKISIISRGRAGGYTLKLPDEDKRMQSKKEFLDDIAMTLGGYVTEQMVFDDLTTGPSNDLQVATSLAREMVTQFGMSDKIGPIALESSSGKTLFGKGVNDKDYSEKVSAEIDAEVKKIINDGLERAEKILIDNRKVLDIIAKRLIEVENIEREEYESILTANGVQFKAKKEDIEHQN